VATSEVEETLCDFPGVQHANVYGVTVLGVEGRIGMAALAIGRELNLAELRNFLIDRLPLYARPVFLRIRTSMDLTGTFKYSKTDLIREGFDPDASRDALYFDAGESFIPIDGDLHQRIHAGEFRL
jgi:fatty-acyl-CoA synthase